MDIYPLELEFETKRAELHQLQKRLLCLTELIEGVQYSTAQETMLCNVGQRYIERANILAEDIFVLSQLLEVVKVANVMDTKSPMH